MADDDTATAETLTWSVGGMDCAACATKIRGAVERLPGVSDVGVSVMAEKLTLRLAAGATAPEAIERTVAGLGYTVAIGGPAPDRGFALPTDATPSPMPATADHDHDHGHDHGPAAPVGTPWHATGKGRLVVLTGGLLVLAWLLRFIVPGAVAPWLFALACVVGLVPIARRAFAAARVGQPFTIEGLMTIAGTGALLIGAAEEAALVVFLFAVGEVLEGVAANRARASIRALGALVPKTALVLGPEGDTRKVDAAALAIGDRVLVRPGDRVPADGTITEGVSGIDESPVTGESVPKTKGPGEEVFAGSINAEAALTVTVTKTAEDNTIARIIRLVEEAQEARAPTERFIDRFSRWYMPAIVGLAALVATALERFDKGVRAVAPAKAVGVVADTAEQYRALADAVRVALEVTPGRRLRRRPSPAAPPIARHRARGRSRCRRPRWSRSSRRRHGVRHGRGFSVIRDRPRMA